MPTDLNGWHPGERALHCKLGYEGEMRDEYWQWIENTMNSAHRELHEANLTFVPVVFLDDSHRPWGSIFAGANGQPGFISSPDSQTLVFASRIWDGDPFLCSINSYLTAENTEQERFRSLSAGIGINFETRLRY
jgi:hypothetical protein